MTHFRNKNDLLAWLTKHCPRQAIVRAIREHGAECLGGFSCIPPTTRPGWIVRVRSSFNKKWDVAVIPCDGKPDYEIRIIKSVPWRNWSGIKLGISPIMRGDRPEWYSKLYLLLKEKSCGKTGLYFKRQ